MKIYLFLHNNNFSEIKIYMKLNTIIFIFSFTVYIIKVNNFK